MATKRGNYLARREKLVNANGRNGGMTAYEVAYIPAGEDFPAVLKVSQDVYGQLAGRESGEAISLDVTTIPPYGDEFVMSVA